MIKPITKKYRSKIVLTIIVVIITSICSSSIAVIFSGLINAATTGSISDLTRWIIITLIYSVSISLGTYFSNILTTAMINKIIYEMRHETMTKILSMKYEDFKKNDNSYYLSLLTNDIKLIEDNYLSPIMDCIQYMAMLITSLVLMFYYSYIVALFSIISTIILYMAPRVVAKTLEKRQTEYAMQLAEYTSSSKNIVFGFDIILRFNVIRKFIDLYKEANINLKNKKLSADKTIVLSGVIAAVTGLLLQLGVIVISACLIYFGMITAGSMLALIQLSSSFVQPIIQVFTNFPKVLSMKQIIKKLNSISNDDDDLSDKQTDQTSGSMNHFENNISIKDLTFSYVENSPVIENLNVEFSKGLKYAIVGGNGCGKTTLLKLLQGSFREYDGKIKLDDHDYQELDPSCIHQYIAAIEQDIYLFNLSIKDNICLFQQYTDDEIQESLNACGINDFIGEFPEGLNHVVGENGSNLSGGQRQRIAIARALIRNTPILILDEGVSSIDEASSMEIEEKLFAIKGLTLIVVTHNMNPETLSQYDQIIFMKEGRVKGMGTLGELRNSNSDFMKFYAPQNKKGESIK